MKRKIILIVFLVIGVIGFTTMAIGLGRKTIIIEAASAFYPYTKENIQELNSKEIWR